MADLSFIDRAGRKIVVTGHYGSGKTEFSVSLVMLLAGRDAGAATPGSAGPLPSKEEGSNRRSTLAPDGYDAGKLAIVDLDIVNPYFRSREKRDMLKAAGVRVYGSFFDTEVTAELPALGADVRAPFEDSGCRVIIDAGGNDSGALILNQFGKYFKDNETTILAVINANRPETRSLSGAIEHISAIEAATGLAVTGVVNNCHLLRETTASTVAKGHELCVSICEATGKELLCDCYPIGIVDPEELTGLGGDLMPLGLYLRPTWLDR